jgi:hypothetical protein
MAETKLKIRPLPDRTPVKMSVAIDPDLQAALQDYAAVYEQTYGEKAAIAALVPQMLTAFLDSDAGFRKARRALMTTETKSPKETPNG